MNPINPVQQGGALLWLGILLEPLLLLFPWLSLQLRVSGTPWLPAALLGALTALFPPREVPVSTCPARGRGGLASLCFSPAGWTRRRKDGHGSVFPGSMGSLRDDQREAR